MGPAAPIVGAATGVIGGINSKNQQKAANAAASSAAAAQQQVAQQIQNNISNQTGEYNKYYAPALSPLSSGITSEGGVASGDIGNLVSTLLQAGIDPSVISAITGIDASQLTQATLNYLQNPNGTNLASATPQASSFYQNEMQNGIDPTYAQNAQNQIQQQLNQSIQNALAQARPGQNINALIKDLNNQALTNRTNLAGQLAGQNQEIKAQGASGLLNSASNLDAQKMNMLQNAATGAQNYNQKQFENIGTSTASAQGILQALQQFLGQGQGNVNSANDALSGLMGNYGTQQANASKAAAAAGQGGAAAWGNAANSLAGLFPQSNPSPTLATYGPMGDYTSDSTAAMPYGPSATGYSPYTGATDSYIPLANAPTVSSPLSVSTPSNGNFNNGAFTAPTMMSGQNYTA